MPLTYRFILLMEIVSEARLKDLFFLSLIITQQLIHATAFY
jgi:hypothetical protein